MDSTTCCVISLVEAVDWGKQSVGGKGAKLGCLAEAGIRVSDGLCVISAAYQSFVQEGGLLAVDGYLGIVTVGAPEFTLEGVL